MFRRFTSERVRRLRRKRLVVFTVIYGLLALTLFLFLWQLSHARFLQITAIAVTGEKTLSHSDVTAIVRTALSGSYGHLFSKRNVLLYPREQIRKTLYETFPSIKEITLDVRQQHELRIHIEERDAAAVACRSVIEGQEAMPRECYFIDETALIFLTAPHFSGSSYVTYELPLGEEPRGTQMLPAEEFTLIHTFISSLKAFSVRATKIHIEKEYLEIEAMTQDRGTVRFLVKRESSYDTTHNTIQTVIESKEFSETSDLSDIDYIDFRFGNKIFYKEKEHIDISIPQENVASEQRTIPELRPL